MVKRHKGKLKRAPPASHLAMSPLAEVEQKGPPSRHMGNQTRLPSRKCAIPLSIY